MTDTPLDALRALAVKCRENEAHASRSLHPDIQQPDDKWHEAMREAHGELADSIEEVIEALATPGGEEYSEAEKVCGEAYQVVGVLLDDLGVFDTPEAEKILDNLSQRRLVHKDVLPWRSLATPGVGPVEEYRCDFCGNDYTKARYCCHARRGYLNAHGEYDATPAPVAVESGKKKSAIHTVGGLHRFCAMGYFKDAQGASDALYELAIASGAHPTTASGFAHTINNAVIALHESVDSLARELDAPAPEAAAQVTDAMVERACVAHRAMFQGTDTGYKLRDERAMRAALTAALRPDESAAEIMRLTPPEPRPGGQAVAWVVVDRVAGNTVNALLPERADAAKTIAAEDSNYFAAPAYLAAPELAGSADAERFRMIARKFQFMKTSESELFLSTLGIHDADADANLSSIIDAARAARAAAPPRRARGRGMAKFVECTLSGRAYRNSEIVNNAVNLDLCMSMVRQRIHWYPDNTGIPSIKFHGCGVEWAFHSDTQRDAEYARIIALTQPEPRHD